MRKAIVGALLISLLVSAQMAEAQPRTNRQHLERVIDRLQHSEKTINAFIDVDLASARVQADQLDANPNPPGSLAGLVVAVKDNIHVAGLRTTAGSKELAKLAISKEVSGDAEVVRRVRAAGAVIIGTTNMDTWARGVRGLSEVAGQTANPLDPSRNAGGSSAGSAAAVAAGMADLALGTDTCGSIRYPASSVGIYGLKPTWGAVPLQGIVPLAPGQDVVGPLAATLETLEAGWQILSGKAPEPVELNRRLGFLGGLGSVSSAWKASAAKAGFSLVDAGDAPSTNGVNLIELQYPIAKRAYKAWRSGQAPATWLTPTGVFGTAPQQRDQSVAMAQRAKLSSLLTNRMDTLQLDALVYPANQALPAKLGEPQRSGNCMLASGSGLPALVVPGIPPAGQRLSIGIELLGRANDESRLLSLAKQLDP